MSASSKRRPLVVAVTGAGGALGQLVLPRLVASPRFERVLAVDLTPQTAAQKVVPAALDLTRADAADRLSALLHRERATVLLHLAFFSRVVRDPTYAHEVESAGTSQVLLAAVRAHIKTLVVPGTTMVYGASGSNPNYITEEQEPAEHPASRFVADKVEVERQLEHYRQTHPELRTAVLRFAPVIGPTIDNPFTRFLGGRFAPAVLGHDPLVQCIHEDDAAEALVAAAQAGKQGPFNVVGRGVLPLSEAMRLAGVRRLALPLPFGRAALEALNAVGVTAAPITLIEYLRHLWVADGSRAERELGFVPRYTCREAITSFARARKASAPSG